MDINALYSDYHNAREVLSAASKLADDALAAGDGWFTDAPDQTTRFDLVRAIADISVTINDNQQAADSNCVEWLAVRSLYQRARAVSAGADEVATQEANNLSQLGTDIRDNAKTAAGFLGVGLGIVAVIVVGLIILERRAV